MVDDKRLPPLPPSDEASLRQNAYNGFYKTTPGQFWGPNEVIRTKEKPFEKCEHEFKMTSTGVECSKCHFGLNGQSLEVRKGVLFYQGKQLPL